VEKTAKCTCFRQGWKSFASIFLKPDTSWGKSAKKGYPAGALAERMSLINWDEFDTEEKKSTSGRWKSLRLAAYNATKSGPRHSNIEIWASSITRSSSTSTRQRHQRRGWSILAHLTKLRSLMVSPVAVGRSMKWSWASWGTEQTYNHMSAGLVPAFRLHLSLVQAERLETGGIRQNMRSRAWRPFKDKGACGEQFNACHRRGAHHPRCHRHSARRKFSQQG